MRHTSRVTSAVVDVVALRRPEVVLRRTTYKDLIVDERVLTQAYPWKAPPSRLQVIAIAHGSLVSKDVTLNARGESILFSPELQAQTRFENASFFEVEWTTEDAASESATIPRKLSRLTEGQIARLEVLFGGLREGATEEEQRAFYEETFAIFRSIGASISVDVAAMTDGPTERDERIARAIEVQMTSLATSADAQSLGALADLSPRQLQRVMNEFASRYGINAGAWRDMRNRWRIQIAVVLLSIPEASVADIAAEVGYRSAPALARAFAAAGFPPPTELRRKLLLPRTNETEVTES